MRMTRCPPLYRKSVKIQKKGKKEIREDKKKIVRWIAN